MNFILPIITMIVGGLLGFFVPYVIAVLLKIPPVSSSGGFLREDKLTRGIFCLLPAGAGAMYGLVGSEKIVNYVITRGLVG